MIQTKWCQYYIICSHCNEDPRAMFLTNPKHFGHACDKCGQIKPRYTVEMVPGSWREDGYSEAEQVINSRIFLSKKG